MIYANLEERSLRCELQCNSCFPSAVPFGCLAGAPNLGSGGTNKPFPTENTKMVINWLGNHTEKKYSQLLKLAVSRLQGYRERSSYQNGFTARPFKTRTVDCKLGLKRGLETWNSFQNVVKKCLMSVFISGKDTDKLYVQFFRPIYPKSKY